MPSKDGKIRVLALHGGGIRGVLPANILAWIEEKTGRPIHDLFDICAGTSTGGLLISALTKPNPLTAREAANLYLQNGKRIFSSSGWRKFVTLGGNVGPKYDGVGLKETLKDFLGDAVLEDALIPTFLVAYALEQRNPIFFKSWVQGGAPTPLVDVCMASSAGPTYFPPAAVHGVWYCDGGVINNNPALSGVIEACMKFGCHTRDCIVLSLGTGLSQNPIAHEKARGWGNIGWVQPLISIFMDGVSDLTHYQLCDLLPADNYLNINTSLLAENAQMDNVSPQNLANLLKVSQSLLETNTARLLTILDRL